jgi:hypothetical protein
MPESFFWLYGTTEVVPFHESVDWVRGNCREQRLTQDLRPGLEFRFNTHSQNRNLCSTLPLLALLSASIPANLVNYKLAP